MHICHLKSSLIGYAETNVINRNDPQILVAVKQRVSRFAVYELWV